MRPLVRRSGLSLAAAVCARRFVVRLQSARRCSSIMLFGGAAIPAVGGPSKECEICTGVERR